MIKRIGVLTSGGDAPGMNAAIRSVVRKAVFEGIEVRGIREGYKGLISGDIIEMNSRSVSNILSRGGTVLKTARSSEFMTREGRAKAAEATKKNGIDALVIIGGNGSLQGALVFYSECGVKSIGVPGTIDNDLGHTDYTIGSHTSVDTVLDAVDKIRDTVSSMERIYVIEVMGRKEPHIAVMAGLAGGAEEVLYPGKGPDIERIAAGIEKAEKKGKRSWIIIVSEGVSSSHVMAEKIRERTGREVRGITLGHIQRGGTPNAPDRILASRMGAYAVSALIDGHFSKMVGIKGAMLYLVPYEKACFERDTDRELYAELYSLTRLLAA
ncbi:MAG: 6-phosphofructokinase [Candidatus Makaraimicrobium thalassicum]|nr:MAG: 6-phosphofructokinase [Candidatus Omnitrophota bacterium]